MSAAQESRPDLVSVLGLTTEELRRLLKAEKLSSSGQRFELIARISALYDQKPASLTNETNTSLTVTVRHVFSSKCTRPLVLQESSTIAAQGATEKRIPFLLRASSPTRFDEYFNVLDGDDMDVGKHSKARSPSNSAGYSCKLELNREERATPLDDQSHRRRAVLEEPDSSSENQGTLCSVLHC